MTKKFKIISILYFLFSIIFFIFSLVQNSAYFHEISNSSLILYELKQTFGILYLYLIGLLFLLAIGFRSNTKMLHLLSFPIGLVLWVIVGFALLMLGLPFTFPVMTLILTVCIFVIFLIRRPDISAIITQEHLFLFIIAAATALIVSTGYNYVILSYDSLYYFINYGRTLAVTQSFKSAVSNNSFVITNVGQFLPIVNTLPAFLKIDQCYFIQAFLTLDIIFIFLYNLYDYAKDKIQNRLGGYLSIMFTLLLAVSTTFIFSSTWVLANMYCMCYIFLAFILTYRKREASLPFSHYILLTLSFLALTLLRKDGIIFTCFILICMSVKKEYNTKSLLYMLIPSILFQTCWIFYVKFTLEADVIYSAFSSITNMKNMVFTFGIMLITVIYLLIYPYLSKKLPFSMPIFILGGTFLLNVFCLVTNPARFIDNVDIALKNFFNPATSCGASVYIIVLLLSVCIVIARKFKIDYSFLFILGYLFLNFASYGVLKKGWVNIDDSCLRVLQQIVPVLLYSIALIFIDYSKTREDIKNV